jgi:thiosulfate/3-mercaptopyruvate sulfurtransferase
MSDIEQRGYYNPNMLVSTEWVLNNHTDPNVRIVESNEDQLLYPSGHIPNAVEIDWVRDLNQAVLRDYLNKEQFQELLSKNGIEKDTTVVFYGDKSNWWACYAFWIFTLYGHTNLRIMDGGRLKWEKEGLPLTKERPKFQATQYTAPERNDLKERAFRDDVLKHISLNGKLVDVRSPDEFTGKKLHMEGYPNEGALRGGHIPGAKSVPWAKAINQDNGTFKNKEELNSIYLDEIGLNPKEDLIAYCRIGERSSLTWFVLKYLLGFTNVKNYDGSWTEWGNLVNVPIERP